MTGLHEPQFIADQLLKRDNGKIPFVDFLPSNAGKPSFEYMLDEAQKRVSKSKLDKDIIDSVVRKIIEVRTQVSGLSDGQFEQMVSEQRFSLNQFRTVNDIIANPHFAHGFRDARGRALKIDECIENGIKELKDNYPDIERTDTFRNAEVIFKTHIKRSEGSIAILERSRDPREDQNSPFRDLDLLRITTSTNLDAHFSQLRDQLKLLSESPLAALMSTEIKEAKDFLNQQEAKFPNSTALTMFIERKSKYFKKEVSELNEVMESLSKETDSFNKQIIVSNYLEIASLGVTETSAFMQKLSEKIEAIGNGINHPLMRSNFSQDDIDTFNKSSKAILAFDNQSQEDKSKNPATATTHRTHNNRRRGAVRVPKSMARAFRSLRNKNTNSGNTQSVRDKYILSPIKKNALLIQTHRIGLAALVTYGSIAIMSPIIKNFVVLGAAAGYGVAVPFIGISVIPMLLFAKPLLRIIDKQLDEAGIRLKTNDFENPINWYRMGIKRHVGTTTGAQDKGNRAEAIRYAYGLYCSLIDLIDDDKIVLSSRFASVANQSVACDYPKTQEKNILGSYADRLRDHPGAIKEILKELAFEQIILRSKDLARTQELEREYLERRNQSKPGPGFLPEGQRSKYLYTPQEVDQLMMTLIDMVSIPSTFNPLHRKEVISGVRIDQDLAFSYYQDLAQALSKAIEDFARVGSVTDPAVLTQNNQNVENRFVSTFATRVSIEGAKTGQTVADGIMHIRYRAVSFLNKMTDRVFPD